MEQLTLDFSGMKGPAVFEKLRDSLRTHCKETVNVKVLVDDGECVTKVNAFSKMTGCQVSVEPRGSGYTLFITGSSCKCF